ncbi:MAG TPA: hypothetical protein VLK27_00750, partial [Chthoniobacterales bacterium]|nr:hypothetical protein [Chthoniobacterales bacterium]
DLFFVRPMRAQLAKTVLICFCFLMTGCPAQWKFVFINGTRKDATVEFTSRSQIVSIPPNGIGEVVDFPVAPEEYMHRRITVKIGAHVVFDEKADLAFRELSPELARYPRQYFLILASGVYPVPDSMHATWQMAG